MSSMIKTTLLMSLTLGIFIFMGGLIGGQSGMLIAFVIGCTMNFFAYWNSDRLVLSLYNAQEVDAYAAPNLFRIVQELSIRAGLPMPRVYIIDEAQPNAFATGRNPEHAALAATTGILRLLSHEELRGVMAHELAHVRNRDTLISTLSASMAGAISILAQLAYFTGGRDSEGRSHPLATLLLSILAPIAALLIQMAISRTREFGADEVGAHISGDPAALASALAKIDTYAHGTPMYPAENHPETAQMMIINPLSGGGINSLFSTHPDTRERIARLQAMTFTQF